jgi:hypothetical protein
MAFKVLALITLLSLLTACREEQRSLPIVDAAGSGLQATSQNPSNSDTPSPMRAPRFDMRRIANEIYEHAPPQYCYSFVLRRPRSQRASAVQARLEQADRMTAAFEPDLLTVDLIGDHANVLSLEVPVVWPAQSYVGRVSSVVEDYFASVDIEDDMCIAGFAEVRLSARDVIDQRIHPIWKARVTSEGLLKSTGNGGKVAAEGAFLLH